MSNGKLSVAQEKARRWLEDHGGDGLLMRGNAVLAAGEVAPHEWRSFKALEQLGIVERYGERQRRIRLIKKDKP